MPDKTINGKPVIEHEARIINMESGFAEKKLCDGPTFSSGTACVYKCSFCYVESFMQKHPAVRKATQDTGKTFQELVIRRKDPVQRVRDQLTGPRGTFRYRKESDTRVIYASPLVDVAANMELVRETAEICSEILKRTCWQIRLLSKSNLLPKLAELIPDNQRDRIIYGVSTGTFDNNLAKAFEEGTALVTKRIESLHWLQDNGYRTFGMICPSLPQEDYATFAKQAADAIRVDKCEHVWAEILNVRGESMKRTCVALRAAGFEKEAQAVEAVAHDKKIWEQYARDTFLAHTKVIPANKLRYLQYVDKSNLDWWKDQEALGAVLLGKHKITAATL